MLCRTSLMELFRENSYKFLTVDYFRKKATLQMLDKVLNDSLAANLKKSNWKYRSGIFHRA